MLIATQDTRTAIPAARDIETVRMPFLLRVLNWLANADARYRQAQKLKTLTDEHLDDMGMSREDANTAFYHRGQDRAREHGRFPIATR